MELSHNFEQALIALDQFLNVVICSIFEPKEKQWADETFSAHCYRCRDKTFLWKCFYYIVNWLFFWQGGNHCYNAYLSELNRKQLPEELRKNDE